jgi:Glycerol dehydrogenase and related enzymes
MGEITLAQLRQAADVACNERSDLHRLPFKVIPEQLMAAMVSTTAPGELRITNYELRVGNTKDSYPES